MFRQLDATMYASPQIGVEAVAEAQRLGIALIINNRPEGESGDQTPGAAIEAAARAAGIDYLALPVTMETLGDAQVAAMRAALARAAGRPVLGYCRSGTRSTFLWALARASAGADPAALAAAAAGAGYDLAPLAPRLAALAAAEG